MKFKRMDTSDNSDPLDFKQLNSREYVEANGLGGFSSGTFSGAHSRKYHGLLVASLNPPVQRTVVVSKMDETVFINNEYFHLGCNQFPGTLYPFGVQYLTAFDRKLFPEWTYEVKGIRIKKTIAAIYGENTTVVLYEVLEAPDKFQFELQPFYNSRDFHSIAKANEHIGHPYIFEKGTFRTMNYQGCPEFFINVPKSQFIEHHAWYNHFEYLQEYERGMEFKEDLFTHGKFSVTLRKGIRLGVIVSLADPTGRDVIKLFRAEKARREALVKPFTYHDALGQLALAADQFIVKRGDLNTIIAGYPWFSDWGRDTMISLPGLCLVTGRIKDAKRILQKFSEYISEGMIPNRFPDNGEKPEYNTIDAVLWFFHALYKYYQYTSDKLFIKSLLPQLRDIIEWHYKGTRYTIQVDPKDDLLSGGQTGVQLTWMDAKVGDWVVTPRTGKPVEINALWYNALSSMDYFLRELNYHADAELYHKRALKVHESFNKVFWNEELNCLFDRIEGEQGIGEIRPNQIYALSLPFPVLAKDRAIQVIEVMRLELLTPRGLRSLSPGHPDYKGKYEGNVVQRDASYHQGAVWAYLTGAYVDALYYAYGDEAKEESTYLLNAIFEHLSEAGLGTLSEIFDGDEPHTPRGCFSQAWSVAEVLRVSVERKLFKPTIKSEKPIIKTEPVLIKKVKIQ